jgi:hypothetical protein
VGDPQRVGGWLGGWVAECAAGHEMGAGWVAVLTDLFERECPHTCAWQALGR